MEKSMLDIAYEFVEGSKSKVSFKKIWDKVCKEMGFTAEEAEAKVSRFYANLMLDGRFVTLGENEWTLRSREKFDKVHIDMNDVYNEVESENDDDSEDKDAEDIAYEKSISDEKETDDSIEPEETEESSENKEENF